MHRSSQDVSCPLPDSIDADAWRRRLIDRLADVQVALWASEPEPLPEQETDRSQEPPAETIATATTELHVEPDTVFIGLSQSKENDPTSRPVSPDGFSVWDQIDEKRHLLSLANKFATDSRKRAIRGRQIFVLSCFATTMFMGIGGLSVSGAFVETGGLSGTLPALASLGPAVGGAGLQTPRIESPALDARRETEAPGGPRSAAADQIAALLSNTPQMATAEEQRRAFLMQKQQISLLPVVHLLVPERGPAPFPFILQALGADLTDATVLLTGLPSGIEPLTGSKLAEGAWQFKLAELPNQGFQIISQPSGHFDMRLGVIRSDGQLVSEGNSRIEFRRQAANNLPRSNPAELKSTRSVSSPEKGEHDRPKGSSNTKLESTAGAPARSVRAARKPATASPEDTISRPMGLGGEPSTKRNSRRNQGSGASPASQPSSIFQPQSHPSWSPFGNDRTP